MEKYNVVRKEKTIVAMRFEPHTMRDMMAWLDERFVAVTAGVKIQVPIGNTTVNIAGNNPEAQQDERLVMVLHDTVKDRIVVVGVGQWVVDSKDFGIEVYNSDEISRLYDFVYETK